VKRETVEELIAIAVPAAILVAVLLLRSCTV
jgi:hypothetical protein